MAKPVWQQRLQAKIDANPLYFVGDSSSTLCKACGGKGKKVTLRMMVNYSFDKCGKCGLVYR